MKIDKKSLILLSGVVVVAALIIYLVVMQLNKHEKTPRITDGTLKNYIVTCRDTGEKATKEFSESVRYTLSVYECVATSPDGSQEYELNLELGNAATTGTASLGCEQNGKQLRVDVVLDSSSVDYVILDQGYLCLDPEADESRNN